MEPVYIERMRFRMRKCLVYLLLVCAALLPSVNYAGSSTQPFYSLTQPPPNLPVTVRVGLNFLHLVSINEYDETFTADIYLYSEWKDPRLAYNAPEGAFPRTYIGADCASKLKEIWWPDFEFVNCGKIDITNSYLAIHPDGTIQLNQGITADFRNTFDYRKLPFDNQRLQIILSSFSWNNKIVVFKTLPDSVIAAKKMKAVYEEIRILGLSVSESGPIDHETPTPSGYSEFIVTLKIQRAPLFYSYQVFFPLLIVIGLCCSVFYIPPEDLGNRINIVLTCVLVFIATKFLLNQDLPKIGYLTFIDKVFFIAYGFAGIVAISCIIEHRLLQKQYPHILYIPKIARIAAPILFLLACLILVILEIY